MLVLLIIMPKCTLAASHAAPLWVMVSIPVGQTDRQTDEWVLDCYVMLSTTCSQCNDEMFAAVALIALICCLMVCALFQPLRACCREWQLLEYFCHSDVSPRKHCLMYVSYSMLYIWYSTLYDMHDAADVSLVCCLQFFCNVHHS